MSSPGLRRGAPTLARPGMPAGAVVLLVAAVMAVCSCARPRQAYFIDDRHVRPAEDATGAAQAPDGAARWPGAFASADAAAAAFDQALAAGEHARVVVLADRLLAAGGALSPQRHAALRASVDHAPAATLALAYQAMEPAAAPALLVAFRLALVSAHTGDDAGARTWLERSQGAQVEPGAIRELTRLLQGRSNVDQDVIAVLVPLSGRFARLGAELEAGIRVAAARVGGDARLVFLDTRGEAAGAEAAVEEAFFQHRALAALGPVGQLESQAAARRAAELGLPIAVLAPGSEGAPAAGVFRLWSPPAWEAAEAVRLALGMGYDRLAVLAPRDQQGHEAAEAFAAAAAAAGAAVVARGSYDPTATALEPDIKAFLGLDPTTNRRLAAHLRSHGRAGWKSFSPDVPFDLLYIPDDHDRAALVVSYLPYFNVELRTRDVMDVIMLKRKHGGRVPQAVQVLGSSAWHHQGLIPRGGAAVEGALVLDVYAGGDNEPYATEDGARFAADYRGRVGREPTAVSAQAHDAAALLLTARSRAQARAVAGQPGAASSGAGQDPRGALVRALAAAELSAGACGPAAIDANGVILRQAVLLRVDGGGFVAHEY